MSYGSVIETGFSELWTGRWPRRAGAVSNELAMARSAGRMDRGGAKTEHRGRVGGGGGGSLYLNLHSFPATYTQTTCSLSLEAYTHPYNYSYSHSSPTQE